VEDPASATGMSPRRCQASRRVSILVQVPRLPLCSALRPTMCRAAHAHVPAEATFCQAHLVRLDKVTFAPPAEAHCADPWRPTLPGNVGATLLDPPLTRTGASATGALPIA
jgi:hypothetical protein